MASANVELVRSICTAWERGDYASAEWADPEIEYVIGDGPSPGSWTGRAGMAEGARANLEVWDEIRFELDEYRELDDERVLALHAYSGRGKASGLEIEQMRAKGAQVFHIRGGKVTRLVHYWDSQRAFADLGLSSPTESSPPRR